MLEKMKRWAEKVGEYQRSMFHRNYKVSSKSEKIDLVSEVDKKSEDMLIGMIKDCYPDDEILAEEGGRISSGEEGSRRVWVIDPLDGTVNYVHGFHIFAISLACLIEGELEAGLIYIPLLEEFYSARRGKGSFYNGKPIRVGSSSQLETAVIATGFPYDHQQNDRPVLELFSRVLPRVGGIRRTGSAAYDLCLVARGIFDGFWEIKLEPWDIAAAVLIVREAGGAVTNFSGEDISLEASEVVAGNKNIHRELRSLLAGG